MVHGLIRFNEWKEPRRTKHDIIHAYILYARGANVKLSNGFFLHLNKDFNIILYSAQYIIVISLLTATC